MHLRSILEHVDSEKIRYVETRLKLESLVLVLGFCSFMLFFIVLQISCLRFIFLINQDLINVIRAEAQKLNS